VIRTDRLILRRWRTSDLEPYAALNTDQVVMEHLPGVQTREETDAFVARIEQQWDDHGWGLWALEVPDAAPFIGFTGLWPAEIVPGRPMVEVGWRLARPYWGFGYATEAAREALRVGFEDLSLMEIVSITVPQNVRSRRVMERIGLTRDPADDFDLAGMDADRYPELVRHVLYRLNRETWRHPSPVAPARP
jgi:RimJ/RimL family protein N-acetyltransferase